MSAFSSQQPHPTKHVVDRMLRSILSAPTQKLQFSTEQDVITCVQSLAPQLTTPEVLALLANVGQHETFVGPPLYVHGAYHKYRLVKRLLAGWAVEWLHAGRVAASYAHVMTPVRNLLSSNAIGDSKNPVTLKQIEQAIDYASLHFFDKDCWDRTNVVVYYKVFDATANVVASCCVGYSWDMYQLTRWRTEHELPTLVQLDTGITAVLGYLHRLEHGHSGQYGYTANCYRCGGCIVDAVCQYCECKFTNVKSRGTDVNTPLPRVAVTHPSKISNHAFEINPVYAWQHAFRRWVGPDPRYISETVTEQPHHRAITIRSKDLK